MDFSLRQQHIQEPAVSTLHLVYAWWWCKCVCMWLLPHVHAFMHMHVVHVTPVHWTRLTDAAIHYFQVGALHTSSGRCPLMGRLLRWTATLLVVAPRASALLAGMRRRGHMVNPARPTCRWVGSCVCVSVCAVGPELWFYAHTYLREPPLDRCGMSTMQTNCSSVPQQLPTTKLSCYQMPECLVWMPCALPYAPLLPRTPTTDSVGTPHPSLPGCRLAAGVRACGGDGALPGLLPRVAGQRQGV